MPKTFLIRLNGIVQGLGFRPFVYNLAAEFGLYGNVSNGLEGVKILINADKSKADFFYKTIIEKAPKKSKIIFSTIEEVDYQEFSEFSIKESETSGFNSLILTPDYAICEECKNELTDPTNRRFQYPFITCTNCGPRYSIIKKLPYDRPFTTMQNFVMCEDCKTEYNDPRNRRFYSQTNSCPNCAITINIYDAQQNLVSENQEEVVNLMVELLQKKHIIALKGIGGYLLLCDACDDSVVEKLRQRKHRPTKPFAVLFPDIQQVEENTVLSNIEKNALESDIAPVVLLEQKPASTISKKVNPALKSIGAMLPYTPLLYLISSKFGKPLIATSGNLSGSPIVYTDEKALTDLSQIADYIMTNNREILIPQDDSVLRFTPKYQQQIIIRRSRGFSLVIKSNLKQSDNQMPTNLALGASMKSTFSLQTPHHVYVSQYLGDLESYETQENFKKVLDHFLSVCMSDSPMKKLYCDAHEGYFSSELAKQMATNWQTDFQKVQHHKAHLLAVLAENDVLNLDDKILGIVWDGTGYGEDAHVWGGEFFTIQSQIFKKRTHFEYFDAILGDKMPREPRISAFSLCTLINNQTFVKDKFSLNEWALYTKIIQKNTLKTSSVGRLFDGVSSLLNLLDKQSYEGDAAILLENLAQEYFSQHGYDFKESYFSEEFPQNLVPTSQLFQGIIEDLQLNKAPNYIAAKFHNSLINSILIMAKKLKIKHLAFSGGVMQNALLVDLIIHHLQSKFTLYFHKNLSPNDESVSFGEIHHV